MQSETELKKPNEQESIRVATAIQDNLLPRWGVKDITSGIERVRVSEIGIIFEAFISPGLFATLCYYQYGNRTRKPFELNGFKVKCWKRKNETTKNYTR